MATNVWRVVSKDDIYGVLDHCELAVARDHALFGVSGNCQLVISGVG